MDAFLKNDKNPRFFFNISESPGQKSVLYLILSYIIDVH